MSLYKDVNGKVSSKRVWGVRFLAVSLGMAITWFFIMMVAYLRNVIFEVEFPYEMFLGLLGTGTTLLGVGTFERPKKDIINKEEL